MQTTQEESIEEIDHDIDPSILVKGEDDFTVEEPKLEPGNDEFNVESTNITETLLVAGNDNFEFVEEDTGKEIIELARGEDDFSIVEPLKVKGNDLIN